MVLKKLKPGMIVYDVRRATGRRAMFSKWCTWTIEIKDIDYEKELVLASWNGNKAEWHSKKTWSKWRLKTPHEGR
jgi:hypothetical protein